MIRPPAPFFSPSSRGRPSFGVGNPKNCSGYVGLAAGFPGTYRILVRDLLVFGMTRRIVRVIVPGRSWVNNQVSSAWRSRQPGNKRNNCSGYWAKTEVEITWAPDLQNLLDLPAAWEINRTIVRVTPRRRCWGFL